MKKYRNLIFVCLVAVSIVLLSPTGITVIQNAMVANEQAKQVIIIDPGHGGSDPGKVGINNALEKDINLSISFKLKNYLEQNGYEVILTRTDDNGLYSLGDNNKKRADMKKRVELINETNPVMTLSIHQNSFTQASSKGAQVFYHIKSPEGKRLAEVIQEQLKQILNNGNKRVAKSNDTYYMLKNTSCPTVIVECGFLSNQEEAELLLDDSYQDKVAYAITEGVKAYMAQ